MPGRRCSGSGKLLQHQHDDEHHHHHHDDGHHHGDADPVQLAGACFMLCAS
jgi:hypothetical protein